MSARRHTGMLLLAGLLALPLQARVLQVPVTSQAGMDSLQVRLDATLKDGADTVDVVFASGLFQFEEDHLAWSEASFPEVTFRILGNGTTLVPVPSSVPQPPSEACWLDLKDRKLVDTRNAVRRADFWPVPVPFRSRLYALRCREEDKSEAECEGMQIILSQWFIGAVYPVVKIKDGFLYFRKDRNYGTWILSELRYGRCLPRYILCKNEDRSDLHRCGASRFLRLERSRFRSVRMSGLSFLGNRLGAPLITLDRVQADSVVVDNCRFEGIRSDAFALDRTDRFRLRNSQFKQCYLSCVQVSKFSEDARIENNLFLDNGLAMSNAPVVRIEGSDFRVADNYFEDFSYAAIRTGTHFTDTDGLTSSGVIERNECCMTPSFRQPPMRALIDGGAIYISTQNRSLTVRDNYIHDISGPHGNRGIFGDDGVVNVTICDNRVFRVEGSYCIDVRGDLEVGRRSNSAISRVNTGNRFYGNHYDGRIRLYVRKDDPDSYLGENVKEQ